MFFLISLKLLIPLQFLSFNDKNTNFANITCGVPQGSILGYLLFLIYVNDLCNDSNILDAMFADDTSLFFLIEIFQHFFLTVNNELRKIGEWFKTNRLSIDI